MLRLIIISWLILIILNQLFLYFDANHSDGHSMMQLLAYRNLKFNTTIALEGISNTPDDNPKGYYVKCDLEYPDELHDDFKEFRTMSRNINTKEGWFSEFQKDIMTQNQMKHGKCPKLMLHLMNHEGYVLHYRNLKYVHKLGVKITKSHRVI